MKRVIGCAIWLGCLAVLRGAEPALDAQALPALPPRSPAEALATFDLDPAFRIELVASEPLIADPVALSFDETGALFVCEMRDYSERRDERLGRISRLVDLDGDGRMDQATAFADGLPWPTGVLCHDRGVFVMAAPDLWFFRDTNGDGVADEKRVVLTGFGELASRLNVQQLPNSLRWGPDQRVHVAEGGNGSRVRRPDQGAGEGLVLRGRDLSFDPRTFDVRAESGGGQYGMAFDDFGRKFVSSNSRHLMQIAYDINLLGESPFSLPAPATDIGVDGPAAPVYRRSPDEAWRVIRTRWRVAGMVPGPIEGGGTPSGYFTGATGLQIARGDRLFAETWNERDGVQEVFIADTGSNLIHRKRLTPDGVLMKGERPDPNERREFLASTDNWFRPVQLENGPGGGLYVVDFYREIIEHPWSLPPGIKQHLDLNRGNDRGRIWQIVKKETLTHRRVNLREATTAELVDLLGHANGWHRDTAARLLFERNTASTRSELVRLMESPDPRARMGALDLLAARGELNGPLIEAGFRDLTPGIRARTLGLVAGQREVVDWNVAPWREQALQLAGDDHPEVRFTLMLAVAQSKPDQRLVSELWSRLSLTSEDDLLLSAALLRVAAPFARELMDELSHGTTYSVLSNLAISLTEQAVRAAPAEQVRLWLHDAAVAATAGGRFETQRLLVLAAAVGRQRGAFGKLRWSDETDLQTAEAVLRIMVESSNPVLPMPAALGDALRLVSNEQMLASFGLLLPAAPSAPAREIIAGALAGREDRYLQAALLDAWGALSPAVRSLVLDSALRHPEMLLPVLARAEADTRFREQLGPAFRQAVRNHPDGPVRRQAVTLFGEASQAGIDERRGRYQGALTIEGDPRRGREVYLIRCASCHRADGEGFALGPDLLTVAAAGRESLMTNILDPSREVAPRFEAWTVKLIDGEEVSGILADETASEVTLRAASGVVHRLSRERITSLVSTGQSQMPAGLDEGLTPEEMADLLRFIESLAETPQASQ